MNDRLLTARTHELAAAIDAPPTTASDDLCRGRGRARRVRAGLVAGALATGVAGGVAWSSVGGARDAAEPAPAPATASSGLATVTPARVGPGTVQDLLDELEARAPKPVRLRVIGRATSWQTTGAHGCRAGWTCEDVSVAGARRARFATDGVVAEVVAELPREGVVLLVVSTEGSLPRQLAYDVR
jgi:hypothetical protein